MVALVKSKILIRLKAARLPACGLPPLHLEANCRPTDNANCFVLYVHPTWAKCQVKSASNFLHCPAPPYVPTFALPLAAIRGQCAVKRIHLCSRTLSFFGPIRASLGGWTN